MSDTSHPNWREVFELARQEKVSVLLVLNRVPSRAKLTEAMTAKLGELAVPVAETRIGNRVGLATALFEGRGITEEIKALADEILGRAQALAAGSAHAGARAGKDSLRRAASA